MINNILTVIKEILAYLRMLNENKKEAEKKREEENKEIKKITKSGSLSDLFKFLSK